MSDPRREFWERAFLAALSNPQQNPTTAAAIADTALEYWDKRWESQPIAPLPPQRPDWEK